nr:hypothetical protein [Streptomyces sp. DSM 41633]
MKGGEVYPDIAVTVFMKVAALADRPEACTAKVGTLAEYLALSPRSVHRGLAALTVDHSPGRPALIQTQRRTHRGGTGQSARRTVVPVEREYVLVPLLAAETLTPRHLRLLALLIEAERRRYTPTLAEVAEHLRHASGQKAGEPLAEATVSTLLADLDTAGWITLDRRGGYQGRHAATVHRAPLHAVPAPDLRTSSPGNGGTSGGRSHGASLAYKEDRSSTDVEQPTPDMDLSAVGAEAVEGAPAVENPEAVEGEGVGALRAEQQSSPSPTTKRTGYTGSGITLSPQMTFILEPMAHLLDGVGAYPVRLAVREVRRQLDLGTEPERLRARLTARLARLDHQALLADPKRVEGLLIGRKGTGGVWARWGCARSQCETGIDWETGDRCHECAEARTERRLVGAEEFDRRAALTRAHFQMSAPVATWHCADCEAAQSGASPGAGLCGRCWSQTPEGQAAATEREDQWRAAVTERNAQQDQAPENEGQALRAQIRALRRAS